MICFTGAAVTNKTNGINGLSIFVHINRFCETTSNQLQIRSGQKLSGKSLGGSQNILIRPRRNLYRLCVVFSFLLLFTYCRKNDPLNRFCASFLRC